MILKTVGLILAFFFLCFAAGTAPADESMMRADAAREVRNPIRDFFDWAAESALSLVPDGGTAADASFRREAAEVRAGRLKFLGKMARLAGAPPECGETFLSDMADPCLEAMLEHFSVVLVEADQLSGEIRRELEERKSDLAPRQIEDAGQEESDLDQDASAEAERRRLLGGIVRLDLGLDDCEDGLVHEMDEVCLSPLLKELGRVVAQVEQLIGDIRREKKLRDVA